MTKADIVDIVAEATGLTKVETEAVIDGFLSTIKNSLQEGERVEFRGFGSFSVKKRMPKKARNPGTGEVVYLPERYVPTFKASKILKELVTKSLIKES
ncbi:MAG: integration host factor subunit beta [Candidatus Marinimicrobia bacterium]|nr:integration host factor subunit beta [Candidatus Neomarinimicrobiota bacterium]TFB10262.1 integration host factor subunit beta [Candidatus Marinimicrobia bacterium MT.SAG.2]